MAVKDLGYGSYTAAKSSIGASYPSAKSPLQKIKDDFLMDIGAKPKDASYYSNLSAKNQSAKDAMNALIATNKNKDHASPASVAAPRKKSAEEQYQDMVAAKKASERAEGQKKRKAFEKKVGEKVAARKKMLKLLNIPTGD